MSVDPLKVVSIIREATEAEILPRFRNVETLNVREKKPHQLVTDADIQAERVLTRELAALIPDAAFVGEESVELRPELMDALNRPGAVWVIDPVDGTGNFANGSPRFAVVVALVIDGVTQMAWIHDPIPNRTVFAQRGKGAWRGDTKLRVLSEAPISQMVGSVKKRGPLNDQALQIARRGSAAHDYLDLVTGQLHFAHFRRLMPWDHAGGVLIHAEAGGYGAMIDKSAYHPVLYPDGQVLLTPGEKSWDDLVSFFDE